MPSCSSGLRKGHHDPCVNFGLVTSNTTVLRSSFSLSGGVTFLILTAANMKSDFFFSTSRTETNHFPSFSSLPGAHAGLVRWQVTLRFTGLLSTPFPALSTSAECDGHAQAFETPTNKRNFPKQNPPQQGLIFK